MMNLVMNQEPCSEGARATEDETDPPKRRLFCVVCGRHTLCRSQAGHVVCEECGARVEEQ